MDIRDMLSTFLTNNCDLLPTPPTSTRTAHITLSQRKPKRKRNPRPAPTVTAPPLRGSDLPGEFSAIDTVTSHRLRPLHMPAARGHGRGRTVGSVREFLVHWASETCPYYEVQKQRATGFRTQSVEVLNDVSDPELDAADVSEPRHSCRQNAGDQHTGPPLFQCERCSHWWHAHCLPTLLIQPPSWLSPSGPAPTAALPPSDIRCLCSSVVSNGRRSGRANDTSDQ